MSDQADGQSRAIEPLIVIASNRGPYTFRRKKDGGFTYRRGDGGLVTALAALADRYDVLWIAAALSRDDQDWVNMVPGQVRHVGNMRLRLIIPDRQAYRQYYNVVANPLLWFIQHELWDAPRQPLITRETWTAWNQGYLPVNKQFADAIADSIPASSNQPVIVFPQDYHLYLVPYFLRARLGDRIQIQPFVHIPWPGPDAWRVLPKAMRTLLFSSLLASDRVGFQTRTDAFNFVQSCRFHLDEAHAHGSREWIEYRGLRTAARAYPISIDVKKVERLAESDEVRMLREQLRAAMGAARLILRVDRIEPSKNILRGLLAFRALLEDHPEQRGKVKMLQLLVPSRMEVSEYQTYLQEVMAAEAFINAEFSDESWEPVRTIIGNNYARAIAAMQIYDVLLVNPVNDGMNLVAKEGPLVNQRDGVLVLSEMAGAVYELGEDALTISPYDVHSTAEALYQALTMTGEERRRRAEALRQQVQSSNVGDWFMHQVADALNAANSSPRNPSTP